MAGRSLLICATEISGDARGARLARELLRIAPDLRIAGLGGRRMRAAGVDVRLDITDRGTVGWFDHWWDLPRYLSALRVWRREIRERRPDVVVVIDAPGISFPFARVARTAGVPVVYFVTPQTWLWNASKAVERLRAHADMVVPTLETEADIYAGAHLPVLYEGHPALDDLIETYGDPFVHRQAQHERPSGGRSDVTDPVRPDLVEGRTDSHERASPGLTIALVPGSRRHAIRRLLPVMLDALALVRRRVAVRAATVSVAARALREEVDACLRARPTDAGVVEGDLGAVLKASDVAMASTGGNLLDAAFARVPAVACYRVDPLTYFGAKHLLRLDTRIPHFTLPNLLAGRAVVPALIQQQATAARLADAVVELATDGAARDAMLAGYECVRAAMGQPGVNGRIAQAIIRLVDPGCAARPPRQP